MDELSWIVQAGLGIGLGIAMMWIKSLRETISQQEGRMDRMNDRVEENTSWMRDMLRGKLTKTDLNE